MYSDNISLAVSGSVGFLDELDDSTLMNIFDQMPSHELIKLAVLRPRFAHIIKRQFRLDDKEIVMSPDGLLYHEDKKKWRNSYITRDSSQTVDALQLFGSKIENFRYEMPYGADQGWAEKILPFEKFYPQATKTIDIIFFDPLNLNCTFGNKTTKVALHAYEYQPIPLNKFFPFMQELSVLSVRKSLIQHYPRLEKLIVKHPPVGERNSTLLEFFGLNPQLRHFDGAMRVRIVPYLKDMSELLPNLEVLSLNLDFFAINKIPENVHFKNVKEFSLSIISGGITDPLRFRIDNITFDQLETLTIETTQTDRAAVYADVMQIILQAKSLKKLEMDLRITTEELLRLVKELPKLQELSIRWQDGIFQSVATLLAENSGLNRVNLYGPYKEKWSDLKEITPQIVSNEMENGISFILKQTQ